MPNYEDFKKYGEWSKSKKTEQPEPAPGRESLLSKLFKGKKASKK